MASSVQRAASRIDPDQVPRPVGQAEPVKEEGGKVYETNKNQMPPPATAVATIVDKGSASCKFMRATMNQVPAYPSTANAAHVPIAVICQPFAELTEFEEPIPLVDLGEEGPLRCPRCKAYMNPHFAWISHGKEVNCNFCGHRFDVLDYYVCSLDERGRRCDYDDRIEIQRGTVDYIAPTDYSESVSSVPTICFVVEATKLSVESGVLPQVFITLRGLLNFMVQPASKIAIITFEAQQIHFYTFHRGVEGARWVTICDIEDPFVPSSPSALCIDALDVDFQPQVEALLMELTTFFDGITCESACGLAAMKVATDLVAASGGGHVIMFHSTLPTEGTGGLRRRDDLKLARSDDSAAVFAPQHQPFFDGIASKCLDKGVAVSCFATPPTGVYIDLASLSVVPRRTGGELVYIPGYDAATHGERLHYWLSRVVVQSDMYSCVFKLRCSKGLTVDCMNATWDPEIIDLGYFQVSRMSVDSTVNFVLSHSERIEWQKFVYMQAACLHTDRHGRRLIRVHTLQLPVTSSLGSIFRFTDVEAVTNVLLKQAGQAALSGITNYKEKMTKSCADMLHAYRSNCASTASAGQLILPESLKLLPLYIGSIRKLPAFRAGLDIRADDRLVSLIQALGMPMPLTSPVLYPRLYTMHPLSDRVGTGTGVGDNVHMPPSIACTFDKMARDRIYLLSSGVALRLYIRDEVTPRTLMSIFGVSHPSQVQDALEKPEEDLPEHGGRIMAVVWQIRSERARVPWQPLTVVIPGTPEESKLRVSLCEDPIAGEMSYVEFLCHVHKQVQSTTD